MEKIRSFIFYTLILGFIGAYFSITLYQGFFILALLGGFVYLLIKIKQDGLSVLSPKGKLFYFPLLGHLSVITISSILFLRVKEQWRRLIEQDFFSFSYFLAFIFEKKHTKKLLQCLAYLSVLGGFLLSLKIFYSFSQTHNGREVQGFWGGLFILGNLLSFSIFASLYLFLIENRKFLKFIWLIAGLTFIIATFMPDTRSVYLGLFTAVLIFYIGTLKVFKSLIYRISSLGMVIALFLLGFYFLIHSPRFGFYERIYHKYGLSEKSLNHISSGRVVIAKGAIELIEKAYREGDYVKLLVGWGYGPQKQYNNLPGGWKKIINEYESFILLTEFINGGIINVIFIIWFYVSAIVLTFRIFRNLKSKEDLLLLTFISAVWVNLIYHLFTLFWVPINSIYYLILGLLEKLTKEE
jgi:hypothetical protein